MTTTIAIDTSLNGHRAKYLNLLAKIPGITVGLTGEYPMTFVGKIFLSIKALCIGARAEALIFATGDFFLALDALFRLKRAKRIYILHRLPRLALNPRLKKLRLANNSTIYVVNQGLWERVNNEFPNATVKSIVDPLNPKVLELPPIKEANRKAGVIRVGIIGGDKTSRRLPTLLAAATQLNREWGGAAAVTIVHINPKTSDSDALELEMASIYAQVNRTLVDDLAFYNTIQEFDIYWNVRDEKAEYFSSTCVEALALGVPTITQKNKWSETFSRYWKVLHCLGEQDDVIETLKMAAAVDVGMLRNGALEIREKFSSALFTAEIEAQIKQLIYK